MIHPEETPKHAEKEILARQAILTGGGNVNMTPAPGAQATTNATGPVYL